MIRNIILGFKAVKMRAWNVVSKILGAVSKSAGKWAKKNAEEHAVELHAAATLMKGEDKRMRDWLAGQISAVVPKKAKKAMSNKNWRSQIVDRLAGLKTANFGLETMKSKEVANKWANSYRSQFVYAKAGVMAMLAFNLMNSDAYGAAVKADEKLVSYMSHVEETVGPDPVQEEVKAVEAKISEATLAVFEEVRGELNELIEEGEETLASKKYSKNKEKRKEQERSLKALVQQKVQKHFENRKTDLIAALEADGFKVSDEELLDLTVGGKSIDEIEAEEVAEVIEAEIVEEGDTVTN